MTTSAKRLDLEESDDTGQVSKYYDDTNKCKKNNLDDEGSPGLIVRWRLFWQRSCVRNAACDVHYKILAGRIRDECPCYLHYSRVRCNIPDLQYNKRYGNHGIQIEVPNITEIAANIVLPSKTRKL